jgi:RNA polymerase sigma-70 factor (ECF subfamily)
MKHLQKDKVALFQRIIDRDDFVINKFFGWLYPKLFLVASRYLADEHDARDAITDVFMKFLESEQAYESFEHIVRTLYLRAYWASQNRMKFIKNDNRRRAITDVSEVSDTEAPVEDDIVRAEFYSLVKEKLETLPPRDQLILEEYFFEGKQCPEIARILNVKDSVVYNAKDRAIKKLQAIFVGKNVIIILFLFFPPE